MTTTTDRYINLFTDYGFKKIFGEEPNKDLLIAFLNSLFKGEEKIKDLSYLKNERLGKGHRDRKAVYDLYCTNDRDEKIVVEVQRVKQEFFKDRSLYYSSFAIQEQAQKGKDWRYELKAVYTVAIMDFKFDEGDPGKLKHEVKLMDVESREVFYDKLTFIYLEVPKFDKEAHELADDYERWLYAFRNLHRLRDMPRELEEGVFRRLFQLAEIARMNPKERSVYEDSLKDYWDLKSAIETYYKEGVEEGRKEGLEEGLAQGEKKGLEKGLEEGERKGLEKGRKAGQLAAARAMLAAGEDMDKIRLYTGLGPEEIGG
jgi:predicted transposase/invertase (TIGR01784 family)